MRRLKNKSGQTLLEALIALALLMIILSAVSVAVLTSLSNSTYIKQQNQATKLGQQGLEYIRDQIQTNNLYSDPTIGLTINTGSRCLDSNNVLKFDPCDVSSPGSPDLIYGIFKREVTFTSGNCGVGGTIANGIQAAVTVSWTSGKCSTSYCNKQTVRSCFLDPNKAFPTSVPTQYQGI